MEKYTTPAMLHQMLLNRIVTRVATHYDVVHFIKGTNRHLETINNVLNFCAEYTWESNNLRKKTKETKVSTVRIILTQHSTLVQSVAANFELPANLLELIKQAREVYLEKLARKQELEFKGLAEEYLNAWDCRAFKYDEHTRCIEASESLRFLAKDGRFIFKEDLENFIRQANISTILADLD